MHKEAYLQVNRGFINNTVNVGGDTVNVNEGYLKPALIGFGVGTLAHTIASLIKQNKIGLKQSLVAGAVGSLVSTGITELKRQKIQSILNKDEAASRRIAQRGFDIKSRTTNAIPNVTGIMEDIVDAGSEVLKSSSLKESEIIRELDQTEDDAHMANSILETSGVVGLMASLRRKGTVSPRDAYRSINKKLVNLPENKILRGASKVNIVYSVMADKDSALADAAAGAQFAMYAPRTIDDTLAAIRHGKKDKKSIIRNTAFAIARATPGLAPIIGRSIKKKFSDS